MMKSPMCRQGIYYWTMRMKNSNQKKKEKLCVRDKNREYAGVSCKISVKFSAWNTISAAQRKREKEMDIIRCINTKIYNEVNKYFEISQSMLIFSNFISH